MRREAKLGAAVLATGIVAGLAVVVFHLALHALVFVFDSVVGIHQLVGLGEISRLVGGRTVFVPFMILLGFIIAKVIATWSGITTHKERGADRVIEVVNGVEVDLPMAEAIGTAMAGVIALGSGVSGGPEGPIAMFVSGPLVALGRRLGLEQREVRIFTAIGVGAALGCLFQAPFAGVLLAGELFVLTGFVGAVILPGLLVTTIAWVISHYLIGGEPLIGHVRIVASGFEPYIIAIVLGGVAGLIGLLYRWFIVGFGAKMTAFSRQSLWRWMGVALVVSGVTSAVALRAPEVLSTGTGWIHLVVAFGRFSSWPFWLLLLVPVARIVLTGSSLGAEAPIGVFGPALIIGAFSGVLLWRIAGDLHVPGIAESSTLFAILMFAAVFGSIGRIPLSMVVIAAEATGSVALMPVVALAVGIALLVVHRQGLTLFGAQPLLSLSPLAKLE